MNDDELRSALNQRTAGSLSADERNDILRAARLQAVSRTRKSSFVPRLIGSVAAIAAVVILVLIALPLLLKSPIRGASPAAGVPSPSPVASIRPPSPEPTASAATGSALPIVNEQGLADLIGDPAWDGKTVLADLPAGAIIHDPCGPLLASPAFNQCDRGTLFDVTGPFESVVVGVRDATPADGVQQDDGNGVRWVKPLEWPSDAGVYAFTIASDAADYLGPVNKSSVLGVADLVNAKSDPSDIVYIVDGWLGAVPPAPCAFPQQGLSSPMPDISSYYCGGSWLGDYQWEAQISGLTVDGALHVQANSYQQFVPNPDAYSAYGFPERGTYLVRNAGCPEVVTGDCPVWRMVGRLDGVTSLPASPPPSPPDDSVPPVHISNETALTLKVVINGSEAATSLPYTESDVDPSAFQAPWHVSVTTSSGRQLVDLSYSASDIDTSGDSQHGVAQRVDLSCGRLDVYAGPPLLGPMPPQSFPPHDCDEASAPTANPAPSTAAPDDMLYIENRGGAPFVVEINGTSFATVGCNDTVGMPAGRLAIAPSLPWELKLVRVSDGATLYASTVSELPGWYVQLGDEALGISKNPIGGPPGPTCPPQ